MRAGPFLRHPNFAKTSSAVLSSQSRKSSATLKSTGLASTKSSSLVDPPVSPVSSGSCLTSSAAKSPTRASTLTRPWHTVLQSRLPSSPTTHPRRRKIFSSAMSPPCPSVLRPLKVWSRSSCVTPPKSRKPSQRTPITSPECSFRFTRVSVRARMTTTFSVHSNCPAFLTSCCSSSRGHLRHRRQRYFQCFGRRQDHWQIQLHHNHQR